MHIIQSAFISGILLLGILLGIPSQGIAQTNGDSDRIYLDEVFEHGETIPSLRSVLIQKNGELLGAKYFRDVTPTRAYNIKSASKSVIALLIGIAIDQGFIPSVNEPITTYFPDFFENNDDPLKRSITIQDLVTMRAGLESTSSPNYGRWVASSSWVRYALNQPFVEDPGGRMVYSTGSTHLLSVIITKATGMSTKRFAERYLFGPMDISVGGWDRDPEGYYMGGNNLALTPANMLKIGQMVLDEGVYNDQRIVSKEWLIESFRTYTFSNFNPYAYGYGWWKQKINGYQTIFAWGFGGQYIFIIPELDATVVFSSNLLVADQRRRYKRPVFQYMEQYIIPFLRSQPE